MKRVCFSADIKYVESPYIEPEEYDSLWWSKSDFVKFRKIAKKTSLAFIENQGGLKVIDNVLRRSKTLAATCGSSEWMLGKNAIEEIVSNANVINSWNHYRS